MIRSVVLTLLPSVVVIRRTRLSTVGDRAFPVAGSRLPLEQSAARRHLSSNADYFSEPPQNLSLFPIISFLTDFAVCTLTGMYTGNRPIIAGHPL